MPTYETQDGLGQGPGLSEMERKLTNHLGLEVVNTRRRSEREFDVEIDFIDPSQEHGTGWLPLTLIYQEWLRRPKQIASLAATFGRETAEACEHDWNAVRDLEESASLALCHSIWALSVVSASSSG